MVKDQKDMETIIDGIDEQLKQEDEFQKVERIIQNLPGDGSGGAGGRSSGATRPRSFSGSDASNENNETDQERIERIITQIQQYNVDNNNIEDFEIQEIVDDFKKIKGKDWQETFYGRYAIRVIDDFNLNTNPTLIQNALDILMPLYDVTTYERARTENMKLQRRLAGYIDKRDHDSRNMQSNEEHLQSFDRRRQRTGTTQHLIPQNRSNETNNEFQNALNSEQQIMNSIKKYVESPTDQSLHYIVEDYKRLEDNGKRQDIIVGIAEEVEPIIAGTVEPYLEPAIAQLYIKNYMKILNIIRGWVLLKRPSL